MRLLAGENRFCVEETCGVGAYGFLGLKGKERVHVGWLPFSKVGIGHTSRFERGEILVQRTLLHISCSRPMTTAKRGFQVRVQ